MRTSTVRLENNIFSTSTERCAY